MASKSKTTNPKIKQESVKPIAEEPEALKEIAVASEISELLQSGVPIKVVKLSGPRPIPGWYGPMPCKLELPKEILEAADIWPSNEVLIFSSEPGVIVLRKVDKSQLGQLEKEQLKRRGA